METTQENTSERLTLRDAVRLSGMSEKTLRRKLEAGLLTGQRENLDYGGFMWMIDARSLADLYPDSAAVRDYVSHLELSLQGRPMPAPEPEAAAGPENESEEAEEGPAPRSDLALYLIEENRGLKEELRDRERQLRSLQERALNLERECGEQRGTAATQARVLEWFQRQPQAALPAPVEETPAAAAPVIGAAPTQKLAWVMAGVFALISLLLAFRAF